MKKNWLSQKERGSPILIHLIMWIALHLGRKTARLLLYPITLYFLLAAPSQRRASKDYFSRLGKEPITIIDGIKHIFYFASTLLDRVFLLTGRDQDLDIKIHGMDMLLEKIETRQGAILLGSHLGSFEVLRASAVLMSKLKLKVLMQVDHTAFITKLLNNLNPEVAKTVIPIGGINAMLEVNKSIKNGEMVGILGDRVVSGEKMVACQFFGSPVNLPAGPILLANTCHAPIILIFGLYRGGNHYDIYLELFSDNITIDSKNREADVKKWVQQYADRLEYYARQAPYNWFNFYDYWKQ